MDSREIQNKVENWINELQEAVIEKIKEMFEDRVRKNFYTFDDLLAYQIEEIQEEDNFIEIIEEKVKKDKEFSVKDTWYVYVQEIGDIFDRVHEKDGVSEIPKGHRRPLCYEDKQYWICEYILYKICKDIDLEDVKNEVLAEIIYE